MLTSDPATVAKETGYVMLFKVLFGGNNATISGILAQLKVDKDAGTDVKEVLTHAGWQVSKRKAYYAQSLEEFHRDRYIMGWLKPRVKFHKGET
mgnify:CR=1 FL=1